jgi:hypothetical protein
MVINSDVCVSRRAAGRELADFAQAAISFMVTAGSMSRAAVAAELGNQHEQAHCFQSIHYCHPHNRQFPAAAIAPRMTSARVLALTHSEEIKEQS